MNNLILQIDTSTTVCSVALSENGQTLQVIDLDEPNAHAAKLTILIEEILKQTGRKMQDLNAVAVSMGPGSYTGLRIGVSTAKGLCYALDIPLIAINTLEALFLGYKGQFGLKKDEAYLPMLDARRMEVYSAVYSHDATLVRATSAEIIDADYFNELLLNYHRVHLFGSGADKFEDLFSANDRVDVLSGFKVSAAFLSPLAFDKFQRKEFEDVAYFEPFYLKDFVVTPAKKKVGLL
ncbi:tRNA (adenosine(37)-N6)-threonylcarbamoyltransferase complex dimerization subunit type 1 TsaB [Sphingobacterium sp. UGAL515B_05]|uniref:tRNA (adenosine(37)-N6)-threonylcarbamoyltransferase complex dimerization subunit type 1 TsaB n=1 Tax=Sphingobacterium sp. UGAL515B_05 TaxID=2986767 RepID=UPI0029544F53|nr:tRNA (adenosine(37)-N6)-threonylcarbamoyltransferase complex dimerization subunit type 1 TsaB [Sphingobacterium sp. UGAL515B_05]WON95273.1 tRNA (adenosine(37)-N6)-threonylcarbamoyltransferase complex dimerization subunit type 1 TsaB [Sphingobacterium sp. UGAL515B_05]